MSANATGSGQPHSSGQPDLQRVPKPPEGIFETATPDELQDRLDLFRERYLLGLMTPAEFNELLLEFQFGDTEERIWSPGVNSRDWHVWRDGFWQRSTPPATLRIRSSTLWMLFEGQQADRPDRTDLSDRTGPSDRTDQTELPHPTSGTRPTSATEPIIPPPPPPGPGQFQDDLPSQPPVDPSRPAFCPGCGQPAGHAKFCTKCGRQIKGANRA